MASPPDDPVLDRTHLAALRALRGGDSGLRRAVRAFRVQTPNLLTAIEGAIATGDRSTIARAAHTLRSSALTLGLPRLARVVGGLFAEPFEGGALSALRTEIRRAEDALAGETRSGDGH